jgi:hypothetical protein
MRKYSNKIALMLFFCVLQGDALSNPTNSEDVANLFHEKIENNLFYSEKYITKFLLPTNSQIIHESENSSCVFSKEANNALQQYLSTTNLKEEIALHLHNQILQTLKPQITENLLEFNYNKENFDLYISKIKDKDLNYKQITSLPLEFVQTPAEDKVLKKIKYIESLKKAQAYSSASPINLEDYISIADLKAYEDHKNHRLSAKDIAEKYPNFIQDIADPSVKDAIKAYDDLISYIQEKQNFYYNLGKNLEKIENFATDQNTSKILAENDILFKAVSDEHRLSLFNNIPSKKQQDYIKKHVHLSFNLTDIEAEALLNKLYTDGVIENETELNKYIINLKGSDSKTLLENEYLPRIKFEDLNEELKNAIISEVNIQQNQLTTALSDEALFKVWNLLESSQKKLFFKASSINVFKDLTTIERSEAFKSLDEKNKIAIYNKIKDDKLFSELFHADEKYIDFIKNLTEPEKNLMKKWYQLGVQNLGSIDFSNFNTISHIIDELRILANKDFSEELVDNSNNQPASDEELNNSFESQEMELQDSENSNDVISIAQNSNRVSEENNDDSKRRDIYNQLTSEEAINVTQTYISDDNTDNQSLPDKLKSITSENVDNSDNTYFSTLSSDKELPETLEEKSPLCLNLPENLSTESTLKLSAEVESKKMPSIQEESKTSKTISSVELLLKIPQNNSEEDVLNHDDKIQIKEVDDNINRSIERNSDYNPNSSQEFGSSPSTTRKSELIDSSNQQNITNKKVEIDANHYNSAPLLEDENNYEVKKAKNIEEEEVSEAPENKLNQSASNDFQSNDMPVNQQGFPFKTSNLEDSKLIENNGLSKQYNHPRAELQTENIEVLREVPGPLTEYSKAIALQTEKHEAYLKEPMLEGLVVRRGTVIEAAEVKQLDCAPLLAPEHVTKLPFIESKKVKVLKQESIEKEVVLRPIVNLETAEVKQLDRAPLLTPEHLTKLPLVESKKVEVLNQKSLETDLIPDSMTNLKVADVKPLKSEITTPVTGNGVTEEVLQKLIAENSIEEDKSILLNEESSNLELQQGVLERKSFPPHPIEDNTTDDAVNQGCAVCSGGGGGDPLPSICIEPAKKKESSGDTAVKSDLQNIAISNVLESIKYIEDLTFVDLDARLNDINIDEFQLSGLGSGEEYIKPKHIWFKGIVSKAKQKAYNNNQGFSLDSSSLLIGVDSLISESHLLGLAYAKNGLELNDTQGINVNINANSILAYWAWFMDEEFHLHSQAKYSQMKVDGIKPIKGAKLFGIKEELSYKLRLNEYLILPKIGVEYEKIYFDKNGEMINSSLQNNANSTLLNGILGVGISKQIPHKSFTIIPQIGFTIDRRLKKKFTGINSDEKKIDWGGAKTSYIFDAKLKLVKSNKLELALNYDYTMRKKFRSHSGALQLKVSF